MEQNNKIKVIFKLDQNDWHGIGSETVWATVIEKNLAQIDNSLFYKKGVNYLDFVNINHLDESTAEFVSVAKHNGHSTYRLITDLDLDDKNFLEHWTSIQNLGCSFESNEIGKRLLSIDVPPDLDINKVFELLKKGEEEKIWFFEEGSCVREVK